MFLTKGFELKHHICMCAATNFVNNELSSMRDIGSENSEKFPISFLVEELSASFPHIWSLSGIN